MAEVGRTTSETAHTEMGISPSPVIRWGTAWAHWKAIEESFFMVLPNCALESFGFEACKGGDPSCRSKVEQRPNRIGFPKGA